MTSAPAKHEQKPPGGEQPFTEFCGGEEQGVHRNFVHYFCLTLKSVLTHSVNVFLTTF